MVVPSFGATGPSSTPTSPKISVCSTPRDAGLVNVLDDLPSEAVPTSIAPPSPGDGDGTTTSEATPTASAAHAAQHGTMTPGSFAASTPEEKGLLVVPVVPASPSYGHCSPSDSMPSPAPAAESSEESLSGAQGSPAVIVVHAPVAPESGMAAAEAPGPGAVVYTPRNYSVADVGSAQPSPQRTGVPRARKAQSSPAPLPLAVAAERAAARAAARADQSASALLISPESDMESVSQPSGAVAAAPGDVEGTADSALIGARAAGTIVFMDMEGGVDAAEEGPASTSAAAAELLPPVDDGPAIVQFRSTPLRTIPEDQSVAHGLGSSTFPSSGDVSESASAALRGVYDSTSPLEPLDLVGAQQASSDDEDWMVSTSGEASDGGVAAEEAGVTPPVLPALTHVEAAARAALVSSVESLAQRVSGWRSYDSSETPVDETDESGSNTRHASPAVWSGDSAAAPTMLSPEGGGGGVDVSSWVDAVEADGAESAGSAPTPPEGGSPAPHEGETGVSVPGSAGVPASPAGGGSTEDLDDYSAVGSVCSPGEGSDAASAVMVFTGRRLEGVGFSAADLEESAGLREALVSGGSIASCGGLAPSPLMVPHAGLGAEASDPELELESPLRACGSPVAWGLRGEVSAPLTAQLHTPDEIGRARSEESEGESSAEDVSVMDAPSPPLLPQRSAVAGSVPLVRPAPEALMDPAAHLPQMQRSPGAAPVAVAMALTRRVPQSMVESRDGPVLGGAAAGVALSVPAEAAGAEPAADEAGRVFAPSPLPETGSYCTAYRETWDVAMSSYGEALQERAARLEQKRARAALRDPWVPRSTPAPSATPSIGSAASVAATARMLNSTGLGVSTGSTASTSAVRSRGARARAASWSGSDAPTSGPMDARFSADSTGARGTRVRRPGVRRGGTPELAEARDALVRESSRHVWSADKSARNSEDCSRMSTEIEVAPAAVVVAAAVRQLEPAQEEPQRQGKLARMKAKVKSGLKGLFKKKNKA